MVILHFSNNKKTRATQTQPTVPQSYPITASLDESGHLEAVAQQLEYNTSHLHLADNKSLAATFIV